MSFKLTESENGKMFSSTHSFLNVGSGLKKTVQSILRSCGYQIIACSSDQGTEKNDIASQNYDNVSPQATYAPWHSDELFKCTFASIKDNTLVDLYRCWELWTLVEQSIKLEGDIIEIGVWRGGTGALLAKKAELCGIRNRTYLCDTFSGVVKAGNYDADYKGGEHCDTSREIVQQLVEDKMKLSNVTILEGVFPEESARYLEEHKTTFRLCHVDVDVYQSAKDIMSWIWKRMVVGGIVVYDDYGFITCGGITRFVNEQKAMADRHVLHNLNGHAVVIKLLDD
jgi:O-methyltransferase